MSRLYTRLLDRIDLQIDHARRAKLRVMEDAERPEVPGEALERIDEAIRSTLELLENVERFFRDDDPTKRAEPGASRTGNELADLCWLASRELATQLDSLERSVQSGKDWVVLTEADRSLERCERALVAVESAVLEHAGLPPTDRFQERLRESLEIRRAYAALRKTFLIAGSPSREALPQELWLVQTQLAALRRRRDHALLRIDDRRELSRLQERIEAACRASGPEGEEERFALWQDLDTFSQLLMGIHRREDLRVHDLRRLREVLGRPGEDSESGARELGFLLGRDPDLDPLLVRPESVPRDDIEPLLRRLEEELQRLVPAL